MIRTGEMTPFGTIVPADGSPEKKTNVIDLKQHSHLKILLYKGGYFVIADI